MGDKLLLKLNMYGRPIANKYCEGKTKRTLERGLKDLKPLRRKRWERGGLRRTWVSEVDVREGEPYGNRLVLKRLVHTNRRKTDRMMFEPWSNSAPGREGTMALA